MNKELSVGSVFTKAWGSFKAAQKSLGTVWLVVIAINFILGLLNSREHKASLAGLLIFVFSIISMYVLTRLSIKAVRGESFVAKDEMLNIDWMKALMLLVLSVIFGLSIGLGMVLLVVPGIIIAIRFMLSSYVFIDENLGLVESAKRSLELTRGHGWDLFLVGLVLFISSILASIITLGLASFIFMPAQILIGAVIYERLRNVSLPKVEGPSVSAK